MSALYDLVAQHNVNKGEKGDLRARAVSRGTIGKDKLYEWVAASSGFHRGQVEAVMGILTEEVIGYLQEGYDVQLDDLGFLSLSAVSRPVKSKKELRSESVRFKGVNFRLSAHARKKLKYIPFERVESSAPVSQTDGGIEQRAEALKHYLSTHPCITRTDYARVARLLKGQALLDLKQFVADGWLVRYGAGRTVVYLMKR